MKNDIDSLLNSLFSGGRLHVGGSTRSRAAQEAEEFFEADGGGGQNGSRGLDRQISDLERINDEAQRSMAEMRRLLESDGAAAGPESRAGKSRRRRGKPRRGPRRRARPRSRRGIPRRCSASAREAAGGAVIGQDAFLNSLFTAFKRPGVTGTPEGKPAAVVVDLGPRGHGAAQRAFRRRVVARAGRRAEKQEDLADRPRALPERGGRPPL